MQSFTIIIIVYIFLIIIGDHTHLPEWPSHWTPALAWCSSSPIFWPIIVSSRPKMSVRLEARFLRLEPICIPSSNTSFCVLFSSTCFFWPSTQRGSSKPEEGEGAHNTLYRHRCAYTHSCCILYMNSQLYSATRIYIMVSKMTTVCKENFTCTFLQHACMRY